MNSTPIEVRLSAALRDLARTEVGPVDFTALTRRVRNRRRRVRALVAGAALATIGLAVGLTQTLGGQSQSVRIVSPPSSVPTTTATSEDPSSRLADYVAKVDSRDQEAATVAGQTWRGSLSTTPTQDGGSLIAVAAFSYDPSGRPVQVLRFADGQWAEIVALPTPSGVGGSSFWLASRSEIGGLAAISVADVTGDGRPDFLIPLNAADNVPGIVLSQDGASSGWRYVPFTQGPSSSPQYLFARDARFQGSTLLTTSDNCIPNCASGANVTTSWVYEPRAGIFADSNRSTLATCDPSSLTTSAVPGSGSGGHLAVVVTFANRRTIPCTMYGFPTAWLILVTGTQVGPSIEEKGGPPSSLVTLRPGGKASTTVWYDNPDVPYPPCTTTNVKGIRLVPPGQSASLTVATSFAVCGPPGPVVGTTPITPGTSESGF